MLLNLTNSTTHDFSVQDPGGSGFTVKVAASTSKTGVSIKPDVLGRVAPLLAAAVTAGKLTSYYVQNDVTDISDDGAGKGVRTVLVSPDTARATDQVIVTNLTTPGAVTVNLPNALPTGTVLEVYDGKGDASSNNVTIDPEGAGTINGASTAVINADNSGVYLVKTASNTWLKMPGSTSVPSGAAGGDLTGTYPNPTVNANKLTGLMVKTYADSATMGAIPVTYLVTVPDAASADYDVVVDAKVEVLEVVVQKRAGAGAASNTITVKNGINAITAALDMNVADKVLVSATSIDDANSTINAAGTLRVSSAKSGGNAACLVAIKCVKRA